MPTFMARCRVDKHRIEKIKDVTDRSEESNITTIDMFYDWSKHEVYSIIDAPNENEIRNHYEKVNMFCDSVVPIEPIRTQTGQNKEKFEIIGELSTRLAHDIRNPLSIIKNIVEIMETKQKLGFEESDLYYGRLHRAVDRISHQIEDVLDFVRPTQTSFERHLLNDILASAIDKIVKPDTIKIKMPTDFVYAVCDFTKIEVVFTNLIMNSVQAMNDSGQIEIEIMDDVDSTSVQISDTGCGIPQDVLPRIFEPLFTTKQTGTGLGLPSCKQIIEHHYGTIKASSKVGVGTTFTVTLPKNQTVALPEIETELVQSR